MNSLSRSLPPSQNPGRAALQSRRLRQEPTEAGPRNAPAGPAAVTAAGAAPSPPTGKDLLFRMMPTGTATVMGLLTVRVQRAANRIRIQAGSLADVVIQKTGNRYAFIENGAAPVEIQDVKTRRTATGTHFDVVLASGKRVGMEISNDRRSLTAMGHELHFEI